MNRDSIKNRLPQLLAVAAVIVVGAVVILVTTSGPPGAGNVTTSSSGGGSASGDKVQIAGFAYHPSALTVKAGSTVTFTNGDSAEHTATSDTEGVFDTGTLNDGKSAAVTLNKPGTYTYYCRFHAFMHGTITVK